MATQHSKITDPPKTVKEAIDWVLRATKKDSVQTGINYDNFCKSLKAVLGDGIKVEEGDMRNLADKLSEFIGWINNGVTTSDLSGSHGGIAGKGYTSAYKADGFYGNNANWPTVCKDAKEANKNSGGGKCCDSTCAKCTSDPKDDCPPEGCCKNCPKRICARIFCLIVPVLHSVFDFLKSNIENEWQHQRITDDEIGKFFEAFGFDTNNMASSSTNKIKSQVNNAYEAFKKIKNGLDMALQNANADSTFFEDATNGINLTPPNSICDILLWLHFLPYSTKYKDVTEELKKHIPHGMKGSSQTIEGLINELSSRIPMLILFIEDKGNTNPQNGNSIFQKIAVLTKCQYIYDKKYYQDPMKVSKVLVSVLPILQWSFETLNQRCGKDNISKIVSSTETKNFLVCLGWKDKKVINAEPKIEGTMQCTSFKKYLNEKLVGDRTTLKLVQETLKNLWKSELQPIPGSSISSASGTHEPQTIREMLMWLQCLPASDAFSKLKKSINSNIHGLPGSLEKVMDQFSSMLFDLPSMYHALEGNFNSLVGDLFKHQGITDGNKEFKYSEDGNDCLNSFSSIIVIVHMVLLYLQQRCNGNEGDWKDLQLDGSGSPPSGAAEKADLMTFLTCIGFGNITPADRSMKGSTFKTDILNKCFSDLTQNGGSEKLKKLYDVALAELKKNSNGGSTAPTTIRQMMLWLIGLPLTKEYNTLTDSNGILNDKEIQNVIEDTSRINSQNIKQNILTSASGLAATMIVIEGNTKTLLDFLKGGFNEGGKGSYSYGETNDSGTSCLNFFKDYSYKVHCQLRFLHYMVQQPGNNGGWKECTYGNGAKAQGGKCQGCVVKTSCLMQFLVATDQDLDKATSSSTYTNQFIGLVTTGSDNSMKDVGMGFNDKLNGTNSRTGNDVRLSLSHICHTEVAKPLTLIMESMVTIDKREPTTLGDYIDIFRQFTCGSNGLWNRRKISVNSGQQTIEQRLTEELKVIDGTEKKGADHVSELKNAIQSLYPQTHVDYLQPTYDLFSLGCNDKQQHGMTCAPYIRPICHSVWNSYAPKIEPSDTMKNEFHTLQWLYDMCYRLLKGLQQLKESFDKCGCCSKDKCGNNIVECPKALPMLYNQGLTFHTPNDLKGNSKKCKGFMDHLSQVIEMKAPLYMMFDKIIGAFYHILLIKARGCVSTTAAILHSGLFTARQEEEKQWKTSFEGYINEAIKKSKNTLECTYLCMLFGNTECKNHNSELIPSPSVPPLVPSEKVTAMEAVIPKYTPPYIDRHHYKTYPKNGSVQGTEPPIPENQYSFTDAINLHIDRSQCVKPTPLSLRSVIDWLLRVTVGKENREENNNIKSLTEALKTVFNTPAQVAGIEDHVTSLVSGIRKFVGYDDTSEVVRNKVGAEKTSVKNKLDTMLTVIQGFIGDNGKGSFGEELGRAMQKGMYSKNKNGGVQFTELIAELRMNLSVRHNGCDPELNCTQFSTPSVPYSNAVEADGLKQLHRFFDELKTFAANWDNIGKSNGKSILPKQKNEAFSQIQYSGSAGSKKNDDYFTKLHEALKQLGLCAEMVKMLENKNSDLANSEKYREKIQAVIDHLQRNVLAKLTDSEETFTSEKSNPSYAVKACDTLIKHTKASVVTEITKEIKESVEKQYTELTQQLNGSCSAHSGSNHKQLHEYLCIEILLNSVTETINDKLNLYQHHLYDLKALCQWLYRMGQLYHAGLHGFLKSLVEHLKHIIEVIKWIEGIDKMIKKLKDIEKEDEVTQTIDDFNEIKDCCKVNEHSNLYNSSSFKTRDNFFTALNCRINNLLHSHLLKELPNGTNDNKHDEKTRLRRTLLTELRLLALDRYTLQVWYDDKAQIRDWITFKGGIVKHSDLDAVKTTLQNLTGVGYNPNDKGKIPVQPPQKRNRIHDFHAICVLQKFNYQEPVAKLDNSLDLLKRIQKQLTGVKGKCDSHNGGELRNVEEVKNFCAAVTRFLNEPYGVLQFAKYIQTILGPNMFSAVIHKMNYLGNTDELNGRTTSQNAQKTSFYKSVESLINGPKKAFDQGNIGDYKLEAIITKLTTFLNTLKKEYIFSYPVVSSTSLPAAAQVQQQDALPMTPSCLSNDSHRNTSICQSCYPYLAKIFIGSIPNLYRHCRMLYEMCNLETGLWYSDELSLKPSYIYNRNMLSLPAYMSDQGYELFETYEDGTRNTNNVRYDLNYVASGGFVALKLESIVSHKGPFREAGLKPLDEIFKTVMQHFWKERNKRRKEREKKLEDEYKKNKLDEKTGLRFRPPPAPLPSTVREVLFWLHELDTKDEFYKNLCDHIFTLCGQSSIQIYDGVISHVLKLSASQALEVLSTVEDPARQYPTYLYDMYSEEHYYDYPIVNISLFFYTFVEKLMAAFLQLNFVCVQCQFVASQGGWGNCRFYSNDKVISRSPKELRCSCTGLESSCPRPLYSLLFNDPKNQLRIPTDPMYLKPFMSKGTMPCGFKLTNDKIAKEPPSASGSVLVEPLKKFVGGHVEGRLNGTIGNTLHTVISLRDLLRYTLCLAVRPPWSMSENMAFFYRVTESWKQKGNVALKNPDLCDALHAEISLFPGTFEGTKLTTAVERFAGIEDKDKHGTRNGTHSNTSHHHDLRTLMGCKEANATSSGTTPAQCSTFIFPLSLDVYTHFDHRNSRAYLSWILNFAFGIYGQLKAMEEMMQERECVRNASKGAPSTCPSLPMCPGVLSALYQSGSSFMDQGKLANKGNTSAAVTNTTTKTCDDFHTVLTGLFNCDSAYCTPLHNLIVQCEAFLWSIRLPFSLVQFSLWSVAILFISYVFVVPLDHFKIKSHLFNRLKYTMHPSLLIADQQRRVSEVAYFSL